MTDGTEKKSRVGSLARRLFAAAVFLPCFFIIAHRGSIYYLILVDTIIITGLFEFYRMMEAKGLRPYKWIGLLSGGALPWYLFFRQGMYANVLLTLTFIAVMIAELLRKDKGHAVYHISVTIFGVLYVSWLGSHLMLLRDAGLIRIEVGDEKRYSLRENPLPEAATYLDHYIHRTIDSREEES